MVLDPDTRETLRRLAEVDRAAQEAARLARDELYRALIEARGDATVRELADVLGISYQRVHQLVTTRNKRPRPK